MSVDHTSAGLPWRYVDDDGDVIEVDTIGTTAICVTVDGDDGIGQAAVTVYVPLQEARELGLLLSALGGAS